MGWLLIKAILSAAIIVAVSELSRRSPRLGGFLLTLPIVSVLALTTTWLRDHDLKNVSQLARETLILVPLGLPFFVPLAFAERLGLGFWAAIVWGIAAARADSFRAVLWAFCQEYTVERNGRQSRRFSREEARDETPQHRDAREGH
jgi:hypothetical protein